MKNIDKLFDAVSYILKLNDNSMNYTKLIKELYFADKESLKQKYFSITGDTYLFTKEGPVLLTLLQLIKGTCITKDFQNKWSNIFRTDNYNISIKESYNKKTLSPNEEKILFHCSDMFKKANCKTMACIYKAEFYPECHESKEDIISLKDIFRSFNFSEEEIKVAVDENKYYENV